MIDIDPTVDFVCKMLLGNPRHQRLTIHFLNAVIRPEIPIIDVEYLNPINEQAFEGDKLSILDILAIDQQGRRFNVEVQRTFQRWLPERLVYYAATQLVEQIGEGEGYHELRPSIAICILKDKLFPLLQYHQQFRLRTVEALELTDCLEIHTLELPKYQPPSNNEVVTDPLDQWAEFFCSAQGCTAEALQARLNSPVFSEAIGVLRMISQNPEQRRQYLERLKQQLDENTRRFAEQQAREESAAQGRAEGLAMGLSQGLSLGLVQANAKQVRMLQQLLKQTPTEAESLEQLSVEQLQTMIDDLQEQLRQRLSW